VQSAGASNSNAAEFSPVPTVSRKVVLQSVHRAPSPLARATGASFFFFFFSRANTSSSFVLANTEALHEKIHDLSSRVRILEDALADAHACYSDQPHPLLSQELLQIKYPLEREPTDTVIPRDDKQDQPDTIDALGSLYAYPTSFTYPASRSSSQKATFPTMVVPTSSAPPPIPGYAFFSSHLDTI